MCGVDSCSCVGAISLDAASVNVRVADFGLSRQLQTGIMATMTSGCLLPLPASPCSLLLRVRSRDVVVVPMARGVRCV